MTNIEKNKNIALEFMDKLSKGDIRAALDLGADNSIWWVAGKSDSFVLAGTKTKKEFAKILIGMGTVLPNGMRLISKNITAEGDRVAVEAESYGETSNGRIYNNEYHFLFIIREGKIQVFKEYSDTLHVKEVLLDR